MKTCCFIGHRKINKTVELCEKVRKNVLDLIVNKEVNVFYFGSASEFDDLCLDVVTKIKKDYPNIKLVYVRSHFAYIDESYTNYLLETYDDTFIPSTVVNAGKASYIERNQEMINESDFCVFYYDENYKPPERIRTKNVLFNYRTVSGTKNAFEFAKRRKKLIINLFE